MRLLLLFGCLWILTGSVLAQKVPTKRLTRPTGRRPVARPATAPPRVLYNDVIYKPDQSTLAARISEITDTTIIYFVSLLPTRKQIIARQDVWKIVFSDGSTNEITPQVAVSATPPTPTMAGQPATEVSTTSIPAPANAVPAARYPGDKTFSRLHITVGPELSIYPAGLNSGRSWLNDSTGFGMKQNAGASLRVDAQLVKWAAVSATAGYAGWELVRSYTRDGFSEYTETKKLTQIPIQLGIKLYPFGGFYILPEGGATLLFSSVRTSVGHPTPADESTTNTPITYGASAGLELRANNLLLDLSMRYQLLNVRNLRYTTFNQSLNEQVSIASLRVGIGFQSHRK